MTTLRLPLRIGSPYPHLLSPLGINGKGCYREVPLPLRTCSPITLIINLSNLRPFFPQTTIVHDIHQEICSSRSQDIKSVLRYHRNHPIKRCISHQKGCLSSNTPVITVKIVTLMHLKTLSVCVLFLVYTAATLI